MIAKEFSLASAKLYNILLNSYREYTGNNIILNDEQPRISSRFYIRKPRIFQKRSNYYGYINTTVIVSELPVLRKYSYPDKIVIALTAFYDKRPVTLQHFQQRLESLGKLLRNVDKEEGEKHFFIYFIAEKFRAGAEEESRRLYCRLNNNRYKAIVKTLTPKSGIFETIAKDITAFLVKRSIKLLSSPGFKYSDEKIFGYPKKFVEYVIILTSRLQGKEPAIDHIRRVREWPIKDLEQILARLLPNIPDSRSKPVSDLSILDPATALIYKYRMNEIKNQI